MEENKQPGKGIKMEMVVAFSAVFISIATLFVYIYQARIMQNQLHTSVWPYVQWTYNNVGDEFSLTVENKGIGPALIKDMMMTVDGKEMGNNNELFKTVLKTTAFDFVNSAVEGVVLSPGERIELFHIYDSLYANEIDKLLIRDSAPHKFELSICYCSVYGDCWKLVRGKVVEGTCSE